MSYEADDMEVPAALSNLALKPQNYDKAILSRDEVRFNAQAISYNNTAKDITIRLNSAGYIDTATAYLYANIKTKYSNCQIIEEGLMGMLGQATLAVNGKIVERIEDVSELLPLLKHSCTQEWLQTEGKLAGQYRYCKSTSYQTSITNTDGTAVSDNDINVSLISEASGVSVKMPRQSGAYSTAEVGVNTTDKLYVGETVRHNSMKTSSKGNGNHAFWAKLPEGTNKPDDTSRTYCLSLGLIFGLFRTKVQTYLPLRNMPMELKISLKPYNEFAIHCPPVLQSSVRQRPIPVTIDYDGSSNQLPNTGTNIAPIITDLDNTNFAQYDMTNVHVLADILVPNESVSARVDAMAAGNEGLSFVIDTYNVNKQPVAYAENINLVSTRSYSHLKDIFTTFKPAELETNLFLQKSDRYYGSVVESVSTQVGSKVMPANNSSDSVNEMFINLRKCLGIQNNLGNSRGVVSVNAYQGKPDSVVAGVGKLPYTHGFIPDLKIARATTGADKETKYFNAHLLPAQAHSDFVIGCNTQRVLASSSLSGLNSIGTSYTCTTKVKFKRFNPSAITDLSSSANSASLDACWGDIDMIATQIMHSDVLLRVSNGLVSVLE